METQFDISQYIQRPLEANPRQLQELDSQLEELSSSGFGIERLPQKLLLRQKALYVYPRISPEFLRMHNKKRWKPEPWMYEREIDIPKFGVYSLDNPNMIVDFGYDFPNSYFQVREPQLPAILIKQLAMSTEIFRDGKTGELLRFQNGSLGYIRNYSSWFQSIDKSLPRKVRKSKMYELERFIGDIHHRHHDGVRIVSTFNCIVPTETREKIIEAKRIFSSNIFVVAETKPEEWSIGKSPEPRFVADPLLLGTIDNDCFYTGKFNTTPLEDYVRREYTG